MNTFKTCLFLFLLVMIFSVDAFAYRPGQRPSQDYYNYSQDYNGNYTRRDNLYKDSDGDGVVNYYDSNDKNPYQH